MHARVFYAATIGFALGIFLRSVFTIDIATITFVSLIAFVFTLLGRRFSKAETTSLLLLAGVLLISCSLGMLRYEIASWSETDRYLEQRIGDEVTLEGVIDREPDVRERTTHLYIDIGQRNVLVFVDRFSEYAYGDRVRVIGTLQKPESFETDLGRTFNYPGYLLARNVAYTMLYPEVQKVGTGKGNVLVAQLLRLKHTFMNTVEALIAEPQIGLGEGLLLGEKRALGEEFEQIFRKTGIIHIVVLSGYNIMLVVAFVMFFFAHVMGLRARMVFGIMAIVAFAILVGLSATVVRASIMAALILIARAFGQTYAVMRGLLLAGCCMLLVNPYLLAFDTGFQLSFVATMGLILAAPWIETQLSRIPATVGIREFLVATLATQFFVLPLLLYQIGEFSVVSVVVNVLVLPMVPVAMLLVFATGIFGAVSTTLALPIAYAAHLSLLYILIVAKWFASLPFASFIVPAFPFWLMVFAYIALGYVIYKLYSRPTNVQSDDELSDWTIVSEDELLGVRR